jgi:hypothetical protein
MGFWCRPYSPDNQGPLIRDQTGHLPDFHRPGAEMSEWPVSMIVSFLSATSTAERGG